VPRDWVDEVEREEARGVGVLSMLSADAFDLLLENLPGHD